MLPSQRFEKCMDSRNAKEFDEYNPCQVYIYIFLYIIIINKYVMTFTKNSSLIQWT